ncbi:hypothetical protein ACQP1O_22395 [Nocardia sp. CA-151230]|uniref:hypothetical protein n=1 Tax=Nocardia sp. CA-151230 TaxID=3239982 RepID=UPI003D8DE02F
MDVRPGTVLSGFVIKRRLGGLMVPDSRAFGDLVGDSVRTMLNEVVRLADGPVAEPCAEIGRNPPKFISRTHSVRLPEPTGMPSRAVTVTPPIPAPTQCSRHRCGQGDRPGGQCAEAAGERTGHTSQAKADKSAILSILSWARAWNDGAIEKTTRAGPEIR